VILPSTAEHVGKEIIMGNFKIEIEAIGGHGVCREVKQGEVIPYEAAASVPGHEREPDVLAKRFVEDFAKSNNVISAKLIHWPDTTPIVDNLLTGVREHGDFMERWQGEEMLRYFAFSHLPEGPMRETSRLFCRLAFMIVRTVPRSPERMVALRKLLEGKDAAVRAAMAVR
jgi:hypothetical protein